MSKCAQKHADLTTSVHEPLRKPEASVCPNPSDVRKRAEWAFMNDRDPDNRIEARRDGALAPLAFFRRAHLWTPGTIKNLIPPSSFLKKKKNKITSNRSS